MRLRAVACEALVAPQLAGGHVADHLEDVLEVVIRACPDAALEDLVILDHGDHVPSGENKEVLAKRRAA